MACNTGSGKELCGHQTERLQYCVGGRLDAPFINLSAGAIERQLCCFATILLLDAL